MGLGVFVGMLSVISTPVRLHITEENPIRVEYEAPMVGFRGEIPARRGLAHRVKARRPLSVPKPIPVAAEGEVLFGTFSTLEAMSYHADMHHNVRVPNPRLVQDVQ